MTPQGVEAEARALLTSPHVSSATKLVIQGLLDLLSSERRSQEQAREFWVCWECETACTIDEDGCCVNCGHDAERIDLAWVRRRVEGPVSELDAERRAREQAEQELADIRCGCPDFVEARRPRSVETCSNCGGSGSMLDMTCCSVCGGGGREAR